MAAAVECVGAIDPHACRAHVEVRFSAKQMADEYELLYRRVTADWRDEATDTVEQSHCEEGRQIQPYVARD
jgi:hypothetical protein